MPELRKKFIVVTSIFEATEAVKKFSKIDGWQLVVVGDRKTPKNWRCENVIYLSPEKQESLGFELTKTLPWNHYCRKMVGYLYAISQGAEMIFDTDDDNEPKSIWPAIAEDNQTHTLSGEKFINIYRYYSDDFVWPRGYPLDRVLVSHSQDVNISSGQDSKVGVWQFLADEDPDVDAIYRLTINKPIYFKEAGYFNLAKGSVCPFNSQNTLFTKDLFPLLYLPAFVTFRFTDILRGLVAQPIMWSQDLTLGFGPATVVQKRNPHNYLKDLESEVPVYLNSEKVVDLLIDFKGRSEATVSDKLILAYELLHKEGIVPDEELSLAKAWVNDLARLSNL